MKKLSLINKVFEGLALSLVTSNSCNSCMSHIDEEEHKDQRKSLLKSHQDQMSELKDVFGGAKALSLFEEPQTVELRVSMHCIGCAKKVEKHISDMEGVSSFQVDLKNKKVVITGDVSPGEVVESISKVMKFTELLVVPTPTRKEVTDANYQLISL